MEKKTNNVFTATEELKKALAEGELEIQNSELIDLEDKAYWVDFTFSSNGNKITIDKILYCQPTGRMHEGRPLLEGVACDIDPAIIFHELADMFNDGTDCP